MRVLILLALVALAAGRLMVSKKPADTHAHIEQLVSKLMSQDSKTHASLQNPVKLHEGKVPSDYLVRNLPGLPAGTNITQYAGYVTINPATAANIFFWLIESDEAPDTKPLTIWFNGGPGCSGIFDGFFLEHGPFRLSNDLSMSINPHSWHHKSNMLYVDQPVGTGLSYVLDPTGYATSESQVDAMFYTFLSEWYAIFNKYNNRALYITSESYGGVFAPSIANHLLQQNNPVLNLQGVAIGNGWIDPNLQTYSYIPFAHGAGFIEQQQVDALTELYDSCSAGFLAQDSTPQCENILGYVSQNTGYQGPQFNTSVVNLYDITEFYSDGGAALWPAGENNTAAYLNRTDVRMAINAFEPYYKTGLGECDGTVNAMLAGDGLLSTMHLLPVLLDQYNIRVMLFSGMYDLICNSLGTDMILNTIEWSGAEGYQNAPFEIFIPLGKQSTINTAPGGYTKQYGNLAFVRINAASHMVPYDQPQTSLEMFNRFINDLPYGDIAQGIPYGPPPSLSLRTRIPVWVAVVASILSAVFVGIVVYCITRRVFAPKTSEYQVM